MFKEREETNTDITISNSKTSIDKDNTTLSFSLGGFGRIEDDDVESVESINPASRSQTIGMWLLGLSFRFSYNVTISAAHDLLTLYEPKESMPKNITVFLRDCNEESTGRFLLINILPELVAQIVSTFTPFCINFRIIVIVILYMVGIAISALSTTLHKLYIGVGITSFSNGLSENTFLSYVSTFDNKHLVLSLCTGTGLAGLLGSLWYVFLTAFNCGKSTIFSTLLITPILIGISYFCVLNKLPSCNFSNKITKQNIYFNWKCFKNKMLLDLAYLPHLGPFIISVIFVFLFEYYINQCLHELIYFEDFILTHSQQYSLYQVTYNVSAFCVKSTLNFITIKSIWYFPIMQGINATILTVEAILFFLPHFTFALVLVFWEGLMGGYTYSTIFYTLYSEAETERRPFAMAFIAIAESIGISCAAVLAAPAHDFICSLPEDFFTWNV